jgi:hypothetical protein
MTAPPAFDIGTRAEIEVETSTGGEMMRCGGMVEF